MTPEEARMMYEIQARFDVFRETQVEMWKVLQSVQSDMGEHIEKSNGTFERIAVLEEQVRTHRQLLHWAFTGVGTALLIALAEGILFVFQRGS